MTKTTNEIAYSSFSDMYEAIARGNLPPNEEIEVAKRAIDDLEDRSRKVGHDVEPTDNSDSHHLRTAHACVAYFNSRVAALENCEKAGVQRNPCCSDSPVIQSLHNDFSNRVRSFVIRVTKLFHGHN